MNGEKVENASEEEESEEMESDEEEQLPLAEGPAPRGTSGTLRQVGGQRVLLRGTVVFGMKRFVWKTGQE